MPSASISGSPAPQTLNDGDIVELQQFGISEWFPRAPGEFWTQRGFSLRRQAEGMVESIGPNLLVLTPRGKSQMIQGGVGTVRLEPHAADEVNYKILGATSSGSLSCGIPLVVPEDVYDAGIRDRLLSQKSISATVRGTYARLPIAREEMVLEAAGGKLPPQLKDWLSHSFFVPRNCILVESLLLVGTVRAGLGLQGAAWSVYEDGQGDYGWTYSSFDPRASDSLKHASEFMLEYGQHYCPGGARFLTEFDETTPRLNAEWPIQDVFAGKINPIRRAQSMASWAEGVGVESW